MAKDDLTNNLAGLENLDALIRRITGVSLAEAAEATIDGKQDELMLRISENIRREHEKSDTFKNAIEELERGE
jgi:hypothetical protein